MGRAQKRTFVGTLGAHRERKRDQGVAGLCPQTFLGAAQVNAPASDARSAATELRRQLGDRPTAGWKQQLHERVARAAVVVAGGIAGLVRRIDREVVGRLGHQGRERHVVLDL